MNKLIKDVTQAEVHDTASSAFPTSSSMRFREKMKHEKVIKVVPPKKKPFPAN